jgi:hypothetical protein
MHVEASARYSDTVSTRKEDVADNFSGGERMVADKL